MVFQQIWLSVETEDGIVPDDSAMPDLGPPTDNPSEDSL